MLVGQRIPERTQTLVNATDHRRAVQRGDQPLDLPPVAEAFHIARTAALGSERRSLAERIVAIALDEVGSVAERFTIVDEGREHGAR